jgi:hypothetical protein
MADRKGFKIWFSQGGDSGNVVNLKKLLLRKSVGIGFIEACNFTVDVLKGWEE